MKKLEISKEDLKFNISALKNVINNSKKDDNGNMGSAYYHEHIFGRTVDAKKQKFPDAPYLPDRKTGFYEGFEPLDDEDIACIVEEMEKLENDPKYEKNRWRIDN